MEVVMMAKMLLYDQIVVVLVIGGHILDTAGLATETRLRAVPPEKLFTVEAGAAEGREDGRVEARSSDDLHSVL